MKILSVGNFTTGWDGSICDEENIAQALENLGHTVVRVQREELGTVTGIPWASQYDFCLIAQWDGYPAWLFDDLRKYKKYPIVYWAFDFQADGQEWHERLVTGSDLYLSKRIADSKYPNWQWLSQDFAPKFLDRIEDYTDQRELGFGPEQDIDVLFTGTYLPWATERNETLKAIDNNFNLVIHSVNAWPGFKDVRSPIMDDGLPELYARSKINISIDHTYERGYWSDRNAQIMCCGGFVLFRHVPLSETVFDNRVVYFHTIEECLEEIRYYLSHPADREHVAKRGYEYANEHLRVNNRVEQMLELVKDVL